MYLLYTTYFCLSMVSNQSGHPDPWPLTSEAFPHLNSSSLVISSNYPLQSSSRWITERLEDDQLQYDQSHFFPLYFHHSDALNLMLMVDLQLVYIYYSGASYGPNWILIKSILLFHFQQSSISRLYSLTNKTIDAQFAKLYQRLLCLGICMATWWKWASSVQKGH